MTETEIKILNIDPVAMRKKLISLNAKHIKNVLQKNHGYMSKANPGVMMRLRYETPIDGDKNSTPVIIFTAKGKWKEIDHMKVVEEHEWKLEDDKPMLGLIELLGFKLGNIREMKRDYYSYCNCTVEICEVPTIPCYIEIEGEPKDIDAVAKALGFSKSQYDARGLAGIYPAAKKNLVFN